VDSKQACQELWEEFADRLLLLARAILGDEGSAEDVLQNVFARLMEGRADPAHPALYMFRSVRNEALNMRRSRLRLRRREEAAWLCATPVDPAVRVEREEFRRQVEARLRQLPSELREAVVLKVWSGLTAEEAGQILEISPKTFESRYYEALRRLEEKMKYVV
jgi:RNA polymerase sigma-70 factor (ECF subfamily)